MLAVADDGRGRRGDADVDGEGDTRAATAGTREKQLVGRF